jgi:uncharacterized membrane protein YgcG
MSTFAYDRVIDEEADTLSYKTIVEASALQYARIIDGVPDVEDEENGGEENGGEEGGGEEGGGEEGGGEEGGEGGEG